MAPNLPDMPVEIFHGIIDELLAKQAHRDQIQHDHSHLLQLRQVCRAIEIKTRKRFGQEYFHVINMFVCPNDLGVNKGILADGLLLGHVREITVSVRIEDSLSDNTASVLDGGLQRQYEQQLRHVFQKVPALEKLTLNGPLLQSAVSAEFVSAEFEKKAFVLWGILLQETVHVISTQYPINLRNLQLTGVVPTLYVEPYQPQEDPLMLFSLTKLTISHSCAEDADIFEPTQSAGTGAMMEMLVAFLRHTTELQSLAVVGEYRPFMSDYPRETGLSPLHRKHSTPIKEFCLGNICLMEEQLTKGLRMLGSSLQRLQLSVVRLDAGSWRTFLASIRQELKLAYVNLAYLYEGYESCMTLYMINRKRVVILADESELREDDDWLGVVEWLSGTYIQSQQLYQQKERDIIEAIADGWVWISPRAGPIKTIILDKAEGDDIEMWLTMIEQEHEMEDETPLGGAYI